MGLEDDNIAYAYNCYYANEKSGGKERAGFLKKLELRSNSFKSVHAFSVTCEKWGGNTQILIQRPKIVFCSVELRVGPSLVDTFGAL